MKTYLYSIIAGCLMLLPSCSDYLDREPDDMLTLDMVFKDKTRTEDWLAGLYINIPSQRTYAGQEGPLSDDQSPSIQGEKNGWSVIGKQIGNWNSSSEDENDYWKQLPKRIRSALIFIQNVKPNDAQLVTQDEVDLMKLEARFMIAYYYAELVYQFGPVPFNPSRVYSIDDSDDDYRQPQTPVDSIVNWVDNELLEVSKGLPASYSDLKKFGRATSLMCLAVRARLLLFAASPLLNGNPDYKGYVNVNGVELFNTTYDPDKWVRATKACKELIDAAQAAGKDLYKVYNADGTIDAFQSLQYMTIKKETEGNNEILFARPDWDYSYFDQMAAPRGCSGLGHYCVTQSLVDAFFMENGLSPILGYKENDYGQPIINEKSGYTEKGFSSKPEIRDTKWIECQGDQKGHEGQVTLKGTYNMYCHREPRFYISVLYNRAWFRSEKRTTRFMTDEADGGPSADSPQNGYLMRKLAHPDKDNRNGVHPYRPSINYRLGEAYLNYAEALNESDPGNTDILLYVNKIRERAGIPQYGNGAGMIPAPTTQDGVRDIIRKERRVELCCESGIRYLDIRRWKLAEEMLNRQFYGMNALGTKLSDDKDDSKAYFVRKPYQTRTYTKKNYWFPVPQAEMDNNPKLVQNPGWF